MPGDPTVPSAPGGRVRSQSQERLDNGSWCRPPNDSGVDQNSLRAASYRLKRRLLGQPLVTEQLSNERLDSVTALGVLSPDCISSTAYGTEEMLTVLVPFVGLAAFSLVLPITFAILVVLILVTFSYREVVMVYTKAGGSYVVARDNFGVRVAQIAAVALLIDYTVTVAVQVAAGTDALASAVPALGHPRYIVVGDLGRGRAAPAVRQPAGHSRGGAAVRAADLPLHRDHRCDDHRRPDPGSDQRIAPGQRECRRGICRSVPTTAAGC